MYINIRSGKQYCKFWNLTLSEPGVFSNLNTKYYEYFDENFTESYLCMANSNAFVKIHIIHKYINYNFLAI
jgi:hypothetical protein